jgi:predicted hydrolase (HD superfamily)
MRSVELVMEAYAEKLGEQPSEWGIAGLLHDADYEKFPDEHPNVIVKILEEKGAHKIAHAISAHYTKWGQTYDTLLDKGLLACDEITGFIIACSQVRPAGINGLTAKSVKKKLKTSSFAAKVERDEVTKGAELFGVPLSDHITFIIEVLEKNQDELDISEK